MSPELPGRQALADLDRRVVPVLALRLDRLVRRGGGRLPDGARLAGRERRVLAALVIVLFACAVAIVVIQA